MVLDTLATLTEDPEDKSDTYRALARHTMVPLKAQGCAVLRLDHTGHYGTSPRGSSAKAADVDATWYQSVSGNAITLTLSHQRGCYHSETIALSGRSTR